MNALVFLLTEQTRCATKLGVFGAICVRMERSIRERVCIVEKTLKIFEFSANV
jgi:hypothetical protein